MTPSAFVMAGDGSCDPKRVPPSLTVEPHSLGYDGQFYYRLALDPFLTQPTDHGVQLPNPPYRQQRLLYPLVVWLLSLGRPSLVPAALILVNFLALCLLGWAGGAYSQSLGRHALWGVTFALYPGFLLSLSRDLTEVLEVSLLLSGLLLLRRERHFLAALLLALAVLAREMALVVVAAGLALWLRPRGPARCPHPCPLPPGAGARQGRARVKVPLARGSEAGAHGVPALRAGAILRRVAGVHQRGKGAPLSVLIPLAAFGLRQVLLFCRWGGFGVGSSARRLGLPFAGLVSAYRENAAHGAGQLLPWLAEVALLLTLALAVLGSFRVSAASALEKVSWALSALLALVLTRAVWVEDWAFLRAVSEFYVLGASWEAGPGGGGSSSPGLWHCGASSR
jgi:hypothetical protein